MPSSQDNTSMHADSPKELRINSPKPFDGNPAKLESFLLDADIYLTCNDKLYSTDVKKILWALSYFSEKEAKRWKMQYITGLKEEADEKYNGSIQWPSWKEFIELLKKEFKNYISVDSAFDQLCNLKQKGGINDHITTFKLLISRAGITQEAVIIDFFKRSLNRNLAEKIVTLGQPKTLQDWYEKAREMEGAYRRWQGQISVKRSDPFKEISSKPEKDPYAMDVDAVDIESEDEELEVNALSPEKRKEFQSKGACFKCGGKGHIAKNCSTRRFFQKSGGFQKTGNFNNYQRGGSQSPKPQVTQNKEVQKTKWKGRELHTHIRGLFQDMDDEEVETCIQLMEQEGF